MSIHDHLPKKSREKKLVQGWVDSQLRAKVSERLKKDKLTWDEFLTAACNDYFYGTKNSGRVPNESEQ